VKVDRSIRSPRAVSLEKISITIPIFMRLWAVRWK
jgi:hypothetical protein